MRDSQVKEGIVAVLLCPKAPPTSRESAPSQSDLEAPGSSTRRRVKGRSWRGWETRILSDASSCRVEFASRYHGSDPGKPGDLGRAADNLEPSRAVARCCVCGNAGEGGDGSMFGLFRPVCFLSVKARRRR